MKLEVLLPLTGVFMWCAYPAAASAESESVDKASPMRAKVIAQRAESFVDGVVRMVDRTGGNIVLRHDPIENLGIPAMTMIFRVANPRLIDSLEAGTAVRFAADRLEGKFTIVQIERR